MPIINSNEYVGDTHSDDAYSYGLTKLNDKYSNSFYDKDTRKLFNMYWYSFTVSNVDILRNSVIISKNAYDLIYSHTQGTFEEFKAETGKSRFGQDYLENHLNLHLEHLTPMGQAKRLLVNLDMKDVDDKHIQDCFNYSALALITNEEQEKLDGKDSKVSEDDIKTMRELQKRFGPESIKNSSIELAEQLSRATKRSQATLKTNGDGLIRLIHLFNMDVKFVSPKGRVLSLHELIDELLNNNFTINQYIDIE